MKYTFNSHLIVTDTSPLIALSIMGLLPVLKKLFNKVLVPEAVISECLDNVTKPHSKMIAKALKEKLIEQSKINDFEFCEQLEQVLDRGEAQAISLAKELNGTALIDEKLGRKVAKREHIACVGSLYILIKAKQNNYIPMTASLIQDLLDHGYYLDEKLISTVLLACDEIGEIKRIKPLEFFQ